MILTENNASESGKLEAMGIQERVVYSIFLHHMESNVKSASAFGKEALRSFRGLFCGFAIDNDLNVANCGFDAGVILQSTSSERQ